MWGDRYFLALFTWFADGTSDTKVCTTEGAPLSQEEKDVLVEFFHTIEDNTPLG